MKPRYYTAQEAMKKLGVSKSTFYYYVEEGRIHKHLPPHKKRGALFVATEIDDMVNALERVPQSFAGNEQRTTLRLARSEDIHELDRVVRQKEQENIHPGVVAESGIAYGSKEGLHKVFVLPEAEVGHVLEKKGHMIGFFEIFPMNHVTLLRILRRKIPVSSINKEEFIPYESGQQIDCLIWAIVPFSDNTHLAASLIKKMLTFFHTLGKRGVEIESVYLVATSREEMSMCRRAGFIMMQLPETDIPRWVPFEMRLTEGRHRFTKNYVQALKSYKKRYPADG